MSRTWTKRMKIIGALAGSVRSRGPDSQRRGGRLDPRVERTAFEVLPAISMVNTNGWYFPARSRSLKATFRVAWRGA